VQRVANVFGQPSCVHRGVGQAAVCGSIQIVGPLVGWHKGVGQPAVMRTLRTGLRAKERQRVWTTELRA